MKNIWKVIVRNCITALMLCVCAVVLQASGNQEEDKYSFKKKSVTILCSGTTNFGYVSAAYFLSQLIHDEFPDVDVQVILEGMNANDVKRFPFFKIAKVIYKPEYTYADKSQKLKIDKWLKDSSAVISTFGDIDANRSLYRHKLLSISQISEGVQDYPDEHIDMMKRFILEYRDLYEDLPYHEKGDKSLEWHLYWHPRGLLHTEENYQPHILDDNYDAEKLATQLLKGHPSIFRGEIPTSSRRFHVGVGRDNDGIFINSRLLKKAQEKEGASFHSDYQNLIARNPQLGEILSNVREGGYYMSYMHKFHKLLEFITMAAFIDGEKETTVLTNIDIARFRKEMFFNISEHKIKEIVYQDLQKEGYRQVLSSGRSEGKTVSVIRLPAIRDPDQYASLVYYSSPVVGVTGNSSLFEAITLGKLPFYEFNTDSHLLVNRDLAKLTGEGLHGFFSPFYRPKRKAKIVKKHADSIREWSDKIIKSKSFNKRFIRALKTFI